MCRVPTVRSEWLPDVAVIQWPIHSVQVSDRQNSIQNVVRANSKKYGQYHTYLDYFSYCSCIDTFLYVLPLSTV